MLGKPFVCMALSSAPGASQRDLAPLVWQRCPLFLPFFNRSALYYLLRQCRQAGLDTVMLLLDEVLYQQIDSLRLLVAGLPLKIEWLPYADSGLWHSRLLEQMTADDPVLLFQNPALDLLPLEQLLAFHTSQQADCSLRLSPRGQGPQVWLDAEAQVSESLTPVTGYDTRCYLMEPDIFEGLLQQPVNLLKQPLLPVLMQAAQYVSGLLSDKLWADWQQPEDYFETQHQILAQGLLEPAHQRRLQHKDATVWIGEDVLIAANVSFAGPVVLGDQVSLAEGVRIQGPAMIGARSRIDAKCRIESSWLWPGCEIGRGSRIRHSWLGEQVEIGPQSQLDKLWVGDKSQLSLARPLPPGTQLGPCSRLEITADSETPA